VTYTLVEKSNRYELENPEGEIIETYDDQRSHPSDTIDVIVNDMDSWEEYAKFQTGKKWDFRIEQS